MQKKAKPPEETREIGRLITSAMDEAGLTSAALAKEAGVRPQAVYSWRTTGRIHKRHLLTLVRLTNKPLSYFLGKQGALRASQDEQLLEIFEDLPDEFREKLLLHANAQWELAHPGKKSKFSPFAGIDKGSTREAIRSATKPAGARG